VGIKGEEGVQAVNASDYAIAQFRFLTPLLLKHGRYNYLRMSNLICFMFYKNICMSLTMFWFNFYCGFSGEKMYTEGAIQFFNLFYTSIPILLYATYDKDVSPEDAVQFPQLYAAGIHNKFFNVSVSVPLWWQSIRYCSNPLNSHSFPPSSPYHSSPS
jgi:magnesium-transporting ATPase (P-type)